MPEILTKHPASLLKELKDMGGKCGVGAKQTILKTCPKENFCALPTGEICVYDLSNVKSMTQIKSTDLSEALTGVPTMFSPSNILFLMIVFALGFLVGMAVKKTCLHKRK